MNISQKKILVFQTLEFLFGKDYVRKLYIKNCIKEYKTHKIIFIHIPKAGGSSITKQLYGKRVGHTPASLIKSILGEKAFSSLFSFSVTRNPYDRIVSSYFYAIQGGGTHGGIRNPGKYSAPEFDSFGSFVTKWLCYQQTHDVDVIFKPQTYFVCGTDGKPVPEWIGKIEKQNEIESILQVKTGRALTLERMNRSKHKDYRNYYNDSVQEIVYNYYKSDFDLFGYNKDL
jgi:hypothetical protein